MTREKLPTAQQLALALTLVVFRPLLVLKSGRPPLGTGAAIKKAGRLRTPACPLGLLLLFAGMAAPMFLRVQLFLLAVLISSTW